MTNTKTEWAKNVWLTLGEIGWRLSKIQEDPKLIKVVLVPDIFSLENRISDWFWLFDCYLNDLTVAEQQNIRFKLEDSKLSSCLLEEYYLDLNLTDLGLNSETLKLNLEIERQISRLINLVNFYEQNLV